MYLLFHGISIRGSTLNNIQSSAPNSIHGSVIINIHVGRNLRDGRRQEVKEEENPRWKRARAEPP